MKMKRLFLFVIAVITAINFGCKQEKTELSIDYEKYTLENGLDVILHVDRSDPIVSLAIQFHVGSNREVEGRTGFAHLFEHMMFQRSENVGEDQFFKIIQDAGGELNLVRCMGEHFDILPHYSKTVGTGFLTMRIS